MDDRQIIDLLFARDEKGIEAISDVYGGSCRRLAAGILADENDVEECVNDAYLGIWNSIPPTRPTSLRAYILGVVRNLSAKRYHHEKAIKRNSIYDEVLDELAYAIPDAETVESAMEANVLAEALNDFLTALKENDRVMFMRRYWFSESVSDIAARFEMSAHTVSVRLSRIRRSLKKFLTERGIFV